MNILQQLQPWADVWWAGTWHSAWQSAVVSAVALAVIAVFRRWPSPLRHGLLVLALVKFAVPPVAPTALGVFGWWAPNVAWNVDSSPPVTAVGRPTAPSSGQSEQFDLSPAEQASAPTLKAPPSSPASSIASTNKSAIVSVPYTPGAGSRRALILPVAMLVHLAGTLACGAGIAWQWRRLRRTIRGAAPLAGPQWADRVARLSGQVGLKRPVALRGSPAVQAPFAAGVLRPVVLLPTTALRDLSDGQLDAVVAHELAHHRRYDLAINWLQVALRALWWWHPLLWLLDSALRRVREECVDDLLLHARVTTDAQYAETLVHAAAIWRPSPACPTALGFSQRLHPLAPRLVRILDGRLTRAPRLSRRGWCALALLAAAVLPGAALRRAQAQPDAAEPNLAVHSGAEPQAEPVPPAAEKPAAAPADGDQVPRIQPPAGGELVVLTLDAETLLPLAGVKVIARWRPRKQPAIVHSATSDDQGRAVLALGNESLGDHLVVDAQAPPALRKAPVQFRWMTELSWIDLPQNITMRLHAVVPIGGAVIDEMGQPLAGAIVSVRGHAIDQPQDRPGNHSVNVADVVTDANGRWSYDLAPPSARHGHLPVRHEKYPSYSEYVGGRADHQTLVTAVVKRKEFRVRGRVFDQAGNPVAGARVREGLDTEPKIPDAVADEQGAFEFPAVPAGNTVLSVTARGLAPELQRILVGPVTPAVDFKLPPGNTVRLRIVDTQDQPVPGAIVQGTAWRGEEYWSGYQSLANQTGRVTWNNAPADAVELYVYTYRHRGTNLTVVPREEEYVVALRESLVVTGSAVDAVTNKKLDEVQITEGRVVDKQRGVVWDGVSTLSANFGTFRVQVQNDQGEVQLRFDSPGYLPTFSPVFSAATEGKLEFHVKLTPIAPPESAAKPSTVAGVVLLPDGAPAVGATLARPRRDRPLFVVNGRLFGRQAPKDIDAETDAAGRFDLSDPPNAGALVALHDVGYAVVARQDINKENTIRLQPWATVTGQLLVRGEPAGDESVTLILQRLSTPGRSYIDFSYTQKTDAQGHFRFERVVGGSVDVFRRVTSELGGVRGTAKQAQVSPGGSFHLTLGDVRGQTVVGKFLLPNDESAKLISPGDSAAHVRRPRAKDGSTEHWVQALIVDRQWQFHVEDVPAGEMEVDLMLIGRIPAPRVSAPDVLALVRHKFTVPPLAAGAEPQTIDLGEIPVKLEPQPAIGQLAPELQGVTITGVPLDAANLAGKLRFVEFWSPHPIYDQDMLPERIALYDEFSRDPRFAMIGVLVGTSAEDAAAAVRGIGLAWPHLWFDRDDPSHWLHAFRVRNSPSNFLIDGSGKVIAKNVYSGTVLRRQIITALESMGPPVTP